VKTFLHLLQIWRVVKRFRAVSSSILMRTALYVRLCFSRRALRDSACSTLRGIPSKRTALPGSSLPRKSSTISITTSFGTRFPASIISLTLWPRGESSCASARSAPPVSKISRLYFAATSLPIVPLPAPCIPKNMRSMGGWLMLVLIILEFGLK